MTIEYNFKKKRIGKSLKNRFVLKKKCYDRVSERRREKVRLYLRL